MDSLQEQYKKAVEIQNYALAFIIIKAMNVISGYYGKNI